MNKLDSYVNQFVDVGIYFNEYTVCQLNNAFLRFSEESGYYFLVATADGWGGISIYPEHIAGIEERTYNKRPSVTVDLGLTSSNQTGWVKSIDALPQRDVPVIGYDSLYGRIGEAYRDWDGYLEFTNSDDCDVTHWQHMPNPPEDAYTGGEDE